MACGRSTFSAAPLRCSAPPLARRRAVSKVTMGGGGGHLSSSTTVQQSRCTFAVPSSSRRRRTSPVAAADIDADIVSDTDVRRGSGDDLMLRVRRGLTAATAAAVIAAGPISMVFPEPAEAITSNNLLFLEAWRAVDKAYVDKTFNGITWFKYRENTVKKTPMDSTEDTYAAIREMLAKLDDPFTRFLEPEKYASLSESTMSANITGVGIEMAYGGGNKEPGGGGGGGGSQVVVVAPTPGGPAERAGVKPADVITAVDGRRTEGLSLYEVAEALQVRRRVGKKFETKQNKTRHVGS